MLVFGTRPEAIKMAPVLEALRECGDLFETHCCVTGQHRELLDQVFKVFEITPDIDLAQMCPGRGLARTAANMMAALADVMENVRPDIVLVHGDTTTAMTAALAAFHEGVPVGHVEAGLRTGNLAAPFPEEANRRIIDLFAAMHFAPLETNRQALLAEGVPDERIVVTGNTVVDALHAVLARLEEDVDLKLEAEGELDAALPFDWRNERFVLVTGHRRENFGSGIEEICAAIAELASRHEDVHFVYPVHLNPHVREPVAALLGRRPRVHLVEPLDYAAFVLAMQRCHLVLTDSGGIQEEGPALGTPVLVMRDKTERAEAVAAGGAVLVGADCAGIVEATSRLLTDKAAHAGMAASRSPYGDGHASRRIVDALSRLLVGQSGLSSTLSMAETVR